MSAEHTVSAIVVVGPSHGDLAMLQHEYMDALQKSGFPYEFLFVIDGDVPDAVETLRKLPGPHKVLKLSRRFGKATAISVALEHAVGDIILTLPAHSQVGPHEIQRVLTQKSLAPMVVCRRRNVRSGFGAQVRQTLFHRLVNGVTKSNFHDLGCGVKAMDRYVLEQLPLYGGNFRFLPILAVRAGFRVDECDVSPSPQPAIEAGFQPLRLFNSLLEVLTIFFLSRFTKRPLRFFGIAGASTFLVGTLVVLTTVIERVLWDVPLAERPALLLGSLLVVLGVQIGALGLIGELIIFTHAKDLKEYNIEAILNSVPSDEADAPESTLVAHDEGKPADNGVAVQKTG